MSPRLVSWCFILTVLPLAAAAPVVSTSATARAFHDSNLFLQQPMPLAAGQTTDGTPRSEDALGLDASVALAAVWKVPGRTAELSYTPQIFRYVDHASENHTDHALAAGFATVGGPWSADVKGRLLYVDGSRVAPVFNGLGGSPAMGGEPVRGRREQSILRASGKVARAWERGFARGIFSSFDQRFHTSQATGTGYCNYADRNETSVGAEVGWTQRARWTWIGAVRAGYQRQADVLGVATNYSNDFVRYLAGFEFNAASTLKLSVLAGRDSRRFGESCRAGYDRSTTTGYGEIAATWTPTKQDTATLSGKRYLWMPGTGRGMYVDSLVELGWKRKWSAVWTTGVTGRLHAGDTSHFNAWAPRRDRIYTAGAVASRTCANGLRVDLELTRDIAVSILDRTPGREYTRTIVAMGVGRTW